MPSSSVLLHIGTQKTGTSSLQWALHSAAPQLAEANLVYPESGRRLDDGSTRVAHHLVAEELRAGSIGGACISLQEELQSETRQCIVSSEAFQNVPAKRLAAVFDPSSTTVIVYFREQVSFLLSSYAQRIHATTSTEPFNAYAMRIGAGRGLNYLRRCEELAEVYGRERVMVRIFDRSLLINEDILADFASIINCSVQAVRGRENPSLNAALVSFKRRRNGIGFSARDDYRALGALVAQVGGPSTIPISERLQNRIRARFAESNRALFDEFVQGPALEFPMLDFSRTRPASDAMDFDQIAELLSAEQERRRRG